MHYISQLCTTSLQAIFNTTKPQEFVLIESQLQRRHGQEFFHADGKIPSQSMTPAGHLLLRKISIYLYTVSFFHWEHMLGTCTTRKVAHLSFRFNSTNMECYKGIFILSYVNIQNSWREKQINIKGCKMEHPGREVIPTGHTPASH